VVTTFGIVEGIYTSIKDQHHFINLCRKRSVFSDEELKQQWESARSIEDPDLSGDMCGVNPVWEVIAVS